MNSSLLSNMREAIPSVELMHMRNIRKLLTQTKVLQSGKMVKTHCGAQKEWFHTESKYYLQPV